ncbi:MAG TPA: NUDIX hydrolase [Steroidobacteraceae bacterium]|nr:NUDIX hydrolase [Steroidobacteraceae bacterium]
MSEEAARAPAILTRMPLKPDVTVAAVSEQDGRFLVVEERINQRLVFNQPAGHVEPGETLLEAVIREVREETAWLFEPAHMLGAYLWRNPSNGRSTLRFAFTGTVSDHRPSQPLDKGIVTTHWLSRAELQEREPRLRSPLVLRCVDDYLGGKRLPLDSVAYLDLHTASSVRAVNL